MSPGSHKEGSPHFSHLVTPVLIGFTLATIVLVVTAPQPPSHKGKVAIYFLTVATGLLLGSFQFSVNPWRRYADGDIAANIKEYAWLGTLKTVFNVLGTTCLFIALAVLVWEVIDAWWIVPVLVIPAAAPAVILWWLHREKNTSGGS